MRVFYSDMQDVYRRINISSSLRFYLCDEYRHTTWLNLDKKHFISINAKAVEKVDIIS